jgi:DNA repair exonuclease SbcCD ATPase subunit
MNPPDQPCQATPAGDLRQQIIDSRVPKNEREWWASREIEKLERELAAAKAECERLTANQRQPAEDIFVSHLCDELTRLRAEVERLKEQLRIESAASDHALHWAEKAEAALADWSVLNLWGGTPEIVHEFIKGQQTRIHHCQDLEAELITERARLDYLGLHMGTRMVAEALNCDYSKCFPIRAAIDAAMKGTP